jgi:hypothetical protein
MRYPRFLVGIRRSELRNQLASATRSGREVIANGTLATVLKCAVYVAQCGDAKMAKQRKFAQGDATVFSVPHGCKTCWAWKSTELTLAEGCSF